jgi:hypothetical protein
MALRIPLPFGQSCPLVRVSGTVPADPAHEFGECRCVALMSADIRAVPADG